MPGPVREIHRGRAQIRNRQSIDSQHNYIPTVYSRVRTRAPKAPRDKGGYWDQLHSRSFNSDGGFTVSQHWYLATNMVKQYRDSPMQREAQIK